MRGALGLWSYVDDNGVGLGSSPRMRGALGFGWREDCTTRIIPAYAGSTNIVAEYMLPAGDHPRVCGEHWG